MRPNTFGLRTCLAALVILAMLPNLPANAHPDELVQKKGLKLRLSEGRPESETPPAEKPAPAEPISEEDARRVLSRLAPIKAEAGDQKDFAIRDRSLPPPRTGATVKDSFPPPEQAQAPDAAQSGPLQVLRRQPEGDVPIAPHLSVTFSQPMIALTSQEDAATTVPVRLTPQPAGQWRWVGTKTILFEPTGRFPMATRYTAEVPAGTRSATGGTLAAASTWSFTTPPPKLETYHPAGDSQPLDPILYAEFDQRVDPTAVLASTKLAAGNKIYPLRLASQSEVDADPRVSALAKRAQPGRWLAFRATGPLPKGASVVVTIGPGTPSAEGPLRTARAQSFDFNTYGEFRVTGQRCGWEDQCRPLYPWFVSLSNPIDLTTFRSSMVTVTPAVDGLKVVASGNDLQINGLTKGRTTYTVTLDPSIRDTFGQELGRTTPLTFRVGSAEPTFSAPGGPMVVLDPSAPPRYSVYTINRSALRVRLYAVQPGDWYAFAAYLRRLYQTDAPGVPPGRLVLERTVPVRSAPDELIETPIDLTPALAAGLGHVIAIVEPVAGGTGTIDPGTPSAARGRRRPRPQSERAAVWVQSTRIGLDAFVDAGQLVAWANSLVDGSPVAGAELSLLPGDAVGTTPASGLARIPLGAQASQTNILVARKGNDVAFLPENSSWWSEAGSWYRQPRPDYLSWYVFDDRGMYRPGEEVRLKGWIRRIGAGPTGDVGPLAGAASSLTWALMDSRGNEVAKGVAEVSALGGFDLAVKLPATMNLGYANVNFVAQVSSGVEGGQSSHAFQVQEFRRPEYEVGVTASDGPHFVGGHAMATVRASYYAGGGLGDAEVNWNVYTTPTTYRPPNRDDFVFGPWVPWWISFGDVRGGPQSEESNTYSFSGRTDASGEHTVRMDFDSVDPARATNVRAEATVEDVNRQAWTGTASFLVHPADVYVGLRSQRPFVQQGDPIVVDAIVVDLDGKAVSGKAVRLRAARLDWSYVDGAWKQQEVDVQEQTLEPGAEPARATFQTKLGGQYRVTATVTDDKGRPNLTELNVWVSGGKQPPSRDLEQEKVTLVPDKKEYRAGDTAEILVQSPFVPAEGVLTLRRSGLVSTERFTMTGPTTTLRIPIQESYVPNVHMQVDLVGAAERLNDKGEPQPKLAKRPAYATGTLNLPVPPLARVLAVKATPREAALQPGEKTSIDVEVRDAAGAPVAGAEMAVVVVDESVLALSGYKLTDPIEVFYATREPDVRDHHSRASVLLPKPEDVGEQVEQSGGVLGGRAEARMAMATRPMADGAAPPPPPAPKMKKADSDAFSALGYVGMVEQESAPIAVRTNFDALALFAPAVVTDGAGKASVPLTLPDNLTRYRVMVVAVAGGKQFGKGESAITARLPLMARPSPPRFLNFGDRFELPVTVQNQTDQPLTVDVAVRASNAALTEGSGRRLAVPANDRVEVRFPAAASNPGTARFQIAASSGRWSDAAEVSLPVWTPATTEAFATYGEIDAGAISQPVKAPPDAIPGFGGLEVTTTSTELHALTDAVLYLQNYPFECSEQISSRVLSVAALKDVLAAFKAEGLPKPEEMLAAIKRDIDRLRGMQNGDGGFPFWRRGQESWPFLSVHVTHALVRAKEKGFDVPDDTLLRARQYLRTIEQHFPRYYGPEARRAITAYALYVRNRMGDRDAARAKGLVREAGGVDKLPLEAVGWLLPVFSADPGSSAETAAIRALLNNRVEETAAAAHFATSYGDDAYLLMHSNRRVDALLLEGLIADQPQSDLIPKLVRGLLAHKVKGRWANTQESVWVLLALDRYFAVYEKTEPNFVSRVWLGALFAGEHAFRGRTTERHQIDIPMRYLIDGSPQKDVVVSKEGAGRLYYRLGLRYAPSNLTLKPFDAGFVVERAYEAVDDPSDVRHEADGTWWMKAGARVRVRLTMVAPTRRYHVALVDPMPAGLESLNAELAVTGTLPRDPQSEEGPGKGMWWRRVWYEHQNLRDERAEAFASLLWEGVYTYTYVCRATTPGSYVVPPAKAEEMYHPETFGRGSTDRVVVE
jgi:alpha-2-macroglobulin